MELAEIGIGILDYAEKGYKEGSPEYKRRLKIYDKARKKAEKVIPKAKIGIGRKIRRVLGGDREGSSKDFIKREDSIQAEAKRRFRGATRKKK